MALTICIQEDVLTAMRFNGDDLFKLDSEQNTLLRK